MTIGVLESDLENVKNATDSINLNFNTFATIDELVNSLESKTNDDGSVTPSSVEAIMIPKISNYNLICKNTDLFVRLEERLYNEFPNFKNFETYFEVKTKRIKRFKTIEENGIKGNDVISVFIIEE